MSKTDPALGEKIREFLILKGVETPTIQSKLDVSNELKKEWIEGYVGRILETLGLDLKDDSLIETPKRVAKMYVDEIFSGLNYRNFPKCTAVENKMSYDEMVVEKATIKSSCEHHLVYFGTAHASDRLGCWVAYMPGKKVLGLSKINRIVDFFSRRPQIQERLTTQIAHALQFILETENVAVVIKSQHFCVLTRGVQDADSYCVTSYMGGDFRTKPELKNEFLQISKA